MRDIWHKAARAAKTLGCSIGAWLSRCCGSARGNDIRRYILDALRWIILALSIALIVAISIDIFNRVDFINDRRYMKFQFWVCMVFVADFFIELLLTPRGQRGRYMRRRWIYLLLSIPYLSVIRHYGIDANPAILYCIRFVPLARGILALVIIYSYLTHHNQLKSILASYLTVLIIAVYMASLIFFEHEHAVNPPVSSFWEALWWGGMQVTTLGCDIYPVTVVGKILSVILSIMGMIMFPLFTVYFTNLIIRRRASTSAPT